IVASRHPGRESALASRSSDRPGARGPWRSHQHRTSRSRPGARTENIRAADPLPSHRTRDRGSGTEAWRAQSARLSRLAWLRRGATATVEDAGRLLTIYSAEGPFIGAPNPEVASRS